VLENSLLQTLKSVNKGVPLPMQDEELTARDPAAGPPDGAELVPQDEGDIVFMEINETVAQEETKTTCMKVVLAILRRAKELDLANGRFNHTHTPELVMNDLKAALKAGKDPWKVHRDDHGAMATCIEDFASSTEVDDLDPSLVLTCHWLELINGLEDTPEFSNSSDIIEYRNREQDGPSTSGQTWNDPIWFQSIYPKQRQKSNPGCCGTLQGHGPLHSFCTSECSK